jgi:hypothetical protein
LGVVFFFQAGFLFPSSHTPILFTRAVNCVFEEFTLSTPDRSMTQNVSMPTPLSPSDRAGGPTGACETLRAFFFIRRRSGGTRGKITSSFPSFSAVVGTWSIRFWDPFQTTSLRNQLVSIVHFHRSGHNGFSPIPQGLLIQCRT